MFVSLSITDCLCNVTNDFFLSTKERKENYIKNSIAIYVKQNKIIKVLVPV